VSQKAEEATIEPIWRSDYASVCFSAYHPFFVLPGMTPSSTTSQDYGFKFQPDQGLSRPETLALYARLTEEGAAEKVAFWSKVKCEGSRVAWAEVRTRLGIEDSSKFRTILWSSIESSIDEAIRAEGDALAAALEDLGIYLPSSTEIQPVMEHQIGQAFKNAGFHDLRLTSEVRDYDVPITTDDLLSSTPLSAFVPVDYSTPDDAPDVRLRRPIWVPSEIYTPDRALKCVVEYESITTDFYGTKHHLEAARLDDLFEGEWSPLSI
jgi:hypothetical protein